MVKHPASAIPDFNPLEWPIRVSTLTNALQGTTTVPQTQIASIKLELSLADVVRDLSEMELNV